MHTQYNTMTYKRTHIRFLIFDNSLNRGEYFLSIVDFIKVTFPFLINFLFLFGMLSTHFLPNFSVFIIDRSH